MKSGKQRRIELKAKKAQKRAVLDRANKQAAGVLATQRKVELGGVDVNASALAPNNSHYAYAYAVGLHATRQDEHALAALSEARTRFPDNAPIQAALRALCADRGGPSRDRRCP